MLRLDGWKNVCDPTVGGLRHCGLGVGVIDHGMREVQLEKLLVIRSPEL